MSLSRKISKQKHSKADNKSRTILSCAYKDVYERYFNNIEKTCVVIANIMTVYLLAKDMKMSKPKCLEYLKHYIWKMDAIEAHNQNADCGTTFDDIIRGLSDHYNVECRVAGNTVSYRHPEYKDKNGKPVSVRGNRLGELYTRKGIEYELTKKSNTRTAEYGLDEAAAELERFVSEDTVPSGTGQTRSGGQIAVSASSRNNGENVQELDQLYDRYRKRVTEDERKSAEHAEHSRAVQKRNKGRCR